MVCPFTKEPKLFIILCFILDCLDNHSYEVRADYGEKDDSLDNHNQTSVAYNTLQSCTTDHHYSSNPASTISTCLTSTYGTPKRENISYDIVLDDKASVSAK